MKKEYVYKSPVIKEVTLQNVTGLMAMSQVCVYGSRIENWIDDGYDNYDE